MLGSEYVLRETDDNGDGNGDHLNGLPLGRGTDVFLMVWETDSDEEGGDDGYGWRREGDGERDGGERDGERLLGTLDMGRRGRVHAGLRAMEELGLGVRSVGRGRVVVSVEEEVVERAAEAERLQIPTQHGAQSFSRRRREEFVLGRDPRAAGGSLFLPAQRVAAVAGLLRAQADPSPYQLLDEGAIASFGVLHSPRGRDALLAQISLLSPLPPLADIRAYFGESAALYFAFASHLSTAYAWLVLPGLVTALVRAFGSETSDAVCTLGFTVFVLLWSTGVMEQWKRKQITLAAAWGCMNFEENERPLPSFSGITRRGAYVGSEFVPASAMLAAGLLPEDAVDEVVHDHKSRRTRLSASAVLTLFLMALVICFMLGFMGIKLALSSGALFGEKYGSILGGVINGLGIAVLNKVFETVAGRLNAWENHRTATEANDALVLKIAAFTLVNAYSGLFYVAFARDAPIFGYGSTCAPDCMPELSTALASVLFTLQGVRLAKEILIPWARSKAASVMHGSSSQLATEEGHLGVMAEDKLAPPPDLLKEYATQVVTLGYVCLFAAAFPLGAVSCCLLGLLEERVDLSKLLLSRRVEPRAAEDIGTWEGVVQTLSHVAVVTNTALLLVTSPHLRNVVADFVGQGEDPGSVTVLAYSVLVAVGIEHLVLLLRYVVAVLIPDMPAAVRERIALNRLAEYRALWHQQHSDP